MAHMAVMVAFGLMAATSPAWASQPEPEPAAGAPAASADARYCMRVEPFTGSRIEFVRCWTRGEWADQGVDVDRDWAKEGVTVLEPGQVQAS